MSKTPPSFSNLTWHFLLQGDNISHNVIDIAPLTTKESTEVTLEDVSKRARAFLTEQHAYLQCVHASETEWLLHMYEANKLANEMSTCKKELKTAMFNKKLASFIAFPSMDDPPLGELAFTDIQLPFKKVDINELDTNELKAVDIRADYDFLLPFEHGQKIVAFQWCFVNGDFDKCYTQMSCFDLLGRQIGTGTVRRRVERDNVVQSGPSEFVVCHFSKSPELSVFNSDLHCMRTVRCKYFTNICCNSKFVFGLWDTREKYDPNCPYSNIHGPYDDNKEQEEQHSPLRIQVHHLDTLSEAFALLVPKKFTMGRIMADEHHVVAISCLGSEPFWRDSASRLWFMSVFDLQAIGNDSGDDEDARGGKTKRFYLVKRHIDLAMQTVWLTGVFRLDGWLVVPRYGPHTKEMVCFNKNGKRSETSTELDTNKLRAIYSSDSCLLFALHDYKLLLKRC